MCNNGPQETSRLLLKIELSIYPLCLTASLFSLQHQAWPDLLSLYKGTDSGQQKSYV